MINKNINKSKFTIVEVVFAIALGTMLIAFSYPAIINAMLQVKASSWQTTFIGEGRLGQNKINRMVQDQKFINLIDEKTVELYSADGDKSTLYYDDDSGDIENRFIAISTPDDDVIVLCRYVSPIDDSEPIFKLTTTKNPTRQRLHVAFHVGDPPDAHEAYYKTGPGYQGLEIRFATAPRNLQQWHDFN